MLPPSLGLSFRIRSRKPCSFPPFIFRSANRKCEEVWHDGKGVALGTELFKSKLC